MGKVGWEGQPSVAGIASRTVHVVYPVIFVDLDRLDHHLTNKPHPPPAPHSHPHSHSNPDSPPQTHSSPAPQ